MSTRKLIFFVIIGIVGLISLYSIWKISQSSQAQKNPPTQSLSIWVVWDTSAQYETLFSEFGTFAPEYRNTTLDIRVFPDYEAYQKILLTTLIEWTGPDIFMVESGGDGILESQIVPIPESFLGLWDFDKVYEDIFLSLLRSEWSGKNLTRSLVGVPIGYETLGIFYHKSLIRSFPKTWSELETLEIPSEKWPIYPINLWLWPAYTPEMTDLMAYFAGAAWGRSTKELTSGVSGIGDYLAYGTNTIKTMDADWNEIARNLQDEQEGMLAEKLSTTDLFMRGKIALFIGFPTQVRELEKAYKRAEGEALDDLILTEKVPLDSLGRNRTNLARYKYLGISKKTTAPEASAKLLEYLMTDVASAKATEAFPLLLSPKRTLVMEQVNSPVSDIFARARMDAFIPDTDTDIFVFDYGMKSEYRKILREYIDRNEKVDINNLIKTLQTNISCLSESQTTGDMSEKCTTIAE